MNILVFAPHRDDEIIGVGGTILKRKAAGDHVTVCIVTAREGMELLPGAKKHHEEMKKAHAFCHIDGYIGFPFWANNLENFPRKDLNQAFYDAIVQAQPECASMRSQDLERMYHDAGQFYFFRAAPFMGDGILVGRDTVPVVLSDAEVQDIDNPEDWEIAEFKYRWLHREEA